MKKLLVMLLMLGLTVIYNPDSNRGFVYYNQDKDNWIIIVDQQYNVLVYFKGVFVQRENLQQGFDHWMKDKVEKGLPFKSIIIPYGPEQKRRY